MKNRIFVLNLFMALTAAVLISSCTEDAEEILIPSIDVPTSEIMVGYAAGDTVVDFSSNVILYATVDPADKSWLSYRFEDNCQTLVVQYIENDTTVERTGNITLSKSGVEEVLTITQEGNPNVNVGGPQKVELGFTIDNSSGYTIYSISAEDEAKIPIGATVVLECPGDEGTASFINPATYAEYAGGSPVNGEFKFVYTQEIAAITGGNGMMAILRDGFDVSATYALFEKTNVNFVVDNSSGYTILSVGADFSEAIPVGATVVIECSSNTGTISLLNPATYAEYAGGEPVNGKFVFKWTPEIAAITAGTGMMGILRDGFEVSNVYTVHVQTDLEFIVDSSSGYTILSVSAEDAAKIPLGATVMLECSSDAGTASFINPTNYAEYAGGSPVNGTFSFIWTKEIIDITRTAGMMAILRDGFEVSAMYCHN